MRKPPEPNPSPPASKFRVLAAALRARPAMVGLVALASGIFAQGLSSPRPGIALCIAAALALVAVFLHQALVRALVLFIATALLGFAAAQSQYNRAAADDILNDVAAAPKLAELQVRLDQDPRFSAANPEYHQNAPSQHAMAAVVAIKSAGQWKPASGAVSLFLDEANPNFIAGRTFSAIGMLQPPGLSNPEIAEYDRRHGIGAELVVNHAIGLEPLDDEPPPRLVRVRQWVRQILSSGFGSRLVDDSHHRGDVDRAILCQLILGDHDPLSKQAQDDFTQSGTAWQLGISGLHIAIVAALIAMAGRLLRWSPRTTLIAATLTTIAYAAIADSGQASWRATLCCLVASCGLLTRRAVDATQVFCVCLLAMLLVNPMQAFDAATQIGVAAVAGLLIWRGPVRSMATWIPRGDLDVALWASSMGRGYVYRSTAIIAALRAAGRWCLGVLAASIVAFASTAPIIAYRFYAVMPWTPLASLMVLPFTIIAMLGGLAKGLLTLLWPGLGPLWAMAAAIPIDLLRHIVGWLATWPGSAVKIGAVSLWTPVICWAGLIGLRLILWFMQPRVGRRAN